MAGGVRPVAMPTTSAGGATVEAPTWVVPAATDEMELRGLLTQPAVIARGRTVFSGLCITCHGAHGEGGLGPNLRDDHWINGSQMTDLVRIISEGKPGTTAMQAMKHTYSAADIAAVAAFIVTLRGGTEGTSKAPEGILQPITY
jgi:cytochrome c oxidase cbb3-type subunit 3